MPSHIRPRTPDADSWLESQKQEPTDDCVKEGRPDDLEIPDADPYIAAFYREDGRCWASVRERFQLETEIASSIVVRVRR